MRDRRRGGPHRDLRHAGAPRQGARARRRPPGRRGRGRAGDRAAADAWQDWSRTPWEERVAIFLRAAELLAGPWRDTLNAATMLGQSKTAHQAEIDAACETIDFFRFNVELPRADLRGAARVLARRLEPLEYRPLEGFVFAISPFNFTAIGANLTSSPALMGCTVVWKPASTAMLSAYYTMKLFEEAGLPPGVINLVYGSGADIGDAALADPDLAGVHFTGSTGVPGDLARDRRNIERYRNYPRIVGETGGKDFVLAHPSADVDAVADRASARRVRVPGSEVLGASRPYAPRTSGRSCASGSPRRRRRSRSATSPTSRTSWAP